MAQDKVLLSPQHFQKIYTGFYLLKTLDTFFAHILYSLFCLYLRM